MPRWFPRLAASRLQATTYLLGIALFSISFLVFLNSSIPFVVTEIIRQQEHVGDALGTLGFADELLALVACPLWGMLSDRVGVRTVAVLGYCIVGVSLISLVQSSNVFPQLLLGRLVFSLGGAACSTMVTAVLPAMVTDRVVEGDDDTKTNGTHTADAGVPTNGHVAKLRGNGRVGRSGSIGHGPSPSLNSELTITPTRYASNSQSREEERAAEAEEEEDEEEKTAGTSQFAGFVGFFTGVGALVALAIFLPLPAYLQDGGLDRVKSLQASYYIVGAIAFLVAIFVLIGLRHLPGEENKSLSALFRTPYDESTRVGRDGHLHTTLSPAPSYPVLVKESLKLAFTDTDIFLGYLGGFVARASSVGISFFIPLFVNAYFRRTGLCTDNPHDISDIKENCKRAYKLAAALSGISETAALICAPIFGWLGGRAAKSRAEWPLFVAALVGVAGYVSFGLLRNPDAFNGDGGQWALLSAILLGVSQIGSIVCSLGLLGRGINREVKPSAAEGHGRPGTAATLTQTDVGPIEGDETAALLPHVQAVVGDRPKNDRQQLKGTIAGVYSLTGGAGILILTKAGGALFDTWSVGAPFFLMAIFNGILLVAIVLVALFKTVRNRRHTLE